MISPFNDDIAARCNCSKLNNNNYVHIVKSEEYVCPNNAGPEELPYHETIKYRDDGDILCHPRLYVITTMHWLRYRQDGTVASPATVPSSLDVLAIDN